MNPALRNQLAEVVRKRLGKRARVQVRRRGFHAIYGMMGTPWHNTGFPANLIVESLSRKQGVAIGDRAWWRWDTQRQFSFHFDYGGRGWHDRLIADALSAFEEDEKEAQ